ncbi:MAG: CDP-alcohol phosphatidyltransferase family protein [Bacteroidota bacterium]|nr:CDP-alcohol phosphatidyltransferase family protein [Candidatus Kapabacteria bacterium]MCS7303234.1 CDP-alcohol phosphatidyltransferase family protein [Candidatus Kapabacteria bacterium]MCX7936216.1 CDP-alcohol phosphatidyltransferase family protein [Chlorobiota bacterium]MDW8074890.1 CDP-alcohol phosphatidyltransferase family protein [Bacteroidota bacterium]MDW8271529.1 CDP-alcohol phosphatidyltransferase family protein [Bacteroidota bacterium]
MRQVPNLLSIGRLLATVPMVWALSVGARELALGLGLLAMASDALDGILARHYHAESEWGRILDPLADKVLAGAVAVTLFLHGALPLWYVLAVVGRDGAIVLGSLAMRRVLRSVPPSLPVGKLAAASVGLALLATIAGTRGIAQNVLLALSAILLAVSLGWYAARLWRTVRLHSTKLNQS